MSALPHGRLLRGVFPATDPPAPSTDEAAWTVNRDQLIELATMLAERLLGEALSTRSETIIAMADQVLDEARSARTIVLEANPTDAETLATHAFGRDHNAAAISVRANAALPRGDLKLHTDQGTVDAQIRPQLDRLAAALRQTLI